LSDDESLHKNFLGTKWTEVCQRINFTKCMCTSCHIFCDNCPQRVK